MRVGRRNQHGIVSIELAIGALLFIFIILTYFELARYVFINNMISVWNYDTVRDTRVWHEKQSDQARADNMKQLLQKRWQPVLPTQISTSQLNISQTFLHCKMIRRVAAMRKNANIWNLLLLTSTPRCFHHSGSFPMVKRLVHEYWSNESGCMKRKTGKRL